MTDKKLLNYLESYITESRKTLFKTVLSQRTKHFTVVLEDIYQAHNTSAVVRTCDVFGIQDLHTIENKYNSKVSRHVAKGSQKWVDVYSYREDKNNTISCLDNLQNQGYKLIATAPHNSSCVLEDFDIRKKSAFIFGSEKSGISEIVKKRIDGVLKIPMFGFTESLNISVAVAIILQNLTSKLKKSNVTWGLSESEKEKIYTNWVKKTIKNVEKIENYYLDKLH